MDKLKPYNNDCFHLPGYNVLGGFALSARTFTGMLSVATERIRKQHPANLESNPKPHQDKGGAFPFLPTLPGRNPMITALHQSYTSAVPVQSQPRQNERKSKEQKRTGPLEERQNTLRGYINRLQHILAEWPTPLGPEDKMAIISTVRFLRLAAVGADGEYGIGDDRPSEEAMSAFNLANLLCSSWSSLSFRSLADNLFDCLMRPATVRPISLLGQLNSLSFE